jgi:ArsR family transcriptional regulator, arsenate/arsenite/antimonite-responsive transcriptional repressor
LSISTEVNIPRHTGLVTATSPIPTAAGVCCAPLVRAPLSAEDAVAVTATLKAIADPARLRLLSLVAAHEGGEACVCDLIEPLGLSQPTVSHHLKVLVDAGLLTREKRGVWAYFTLVPGALDAVAAVLATPPARS